MNVETAIRQAAGEYGIDPSYMLATAQRESNFDPYSRDPGSSARGLFGMLRANRYRYGGDTADPLEQARAYGRFAQDVQNEMARNLGRAPTGQELYLGHYWGGGRAARIISGQTAPETPVSEIFTPQELAANPNFGRAGTAGALKAQVMGDMDRRMARFGGQTLADLSQYTESASPTSGAPPAPGPDLSEYTG